MTNLREYLNSQNPPLSKCLEGKKTEGAHH